MKRVTRFLVATVFAIVATRGETIVGKGQTTNRIALEAGELAVIQSARVEGFDWDRKSTWQAGTNGAELGFNAPGEYPNERKPMLLAGPGSLAVGFPHVITFQRVRTTNAATLILNNEPRRIKVAAGQRCSFTGCTGWGASKQVTFAFVPPGAEFTERMKDTERVYLWVSVDPFVIDGPWDVLVWSSEPRVVTYLLQQAVVKLPYPAFNNSKAVEIQNSDDGVLWETFALILPGADSQNFFRLDAK